MKDEGIRWIIIKRCSDEGKGARKEAMVERKEMKTTVGKVTTNPIKNGGRISRATRWNTNVFQTGRINKVYNSCKRDKRDDSETRARRKRSRPCVVGSLTPKAAFEGLVTVRVYTGCSVVAKSKIVSLKIFLLEKNIFRSKTTFETQCIGSVTDWPLSVRHDIFENPTALTSAGEHQLPNNEVAKNSENGSTEIFQQCL